MRTTPLTKRETLLPDAPKEAKLPPVEPIDGDTSEWDMPLMPAPVRPTDTIKVRLIYGGRGKPAPVAYPDDKIAE